MFSSTVNTEPYSRYQDHTALFQFSFNYQSNLENTKQINKKVYILKTFKIHIKIWLFPKQI